MALTLAACAHQPTKNDDYDDDDTNLYIEFSYPYLMLDRTRELAKLRYSTSDIDTRNDPRELARVLRETAWEYNAEISSLCAQGLYAELSCLPPLNPPWLFESPRASPSIEELRQREELVHERVRPLWDAACADFRERHPGVTGGDYMQYCSIE
jgi:hypothetical protein